MELNDDAPSLEGANAFTESWLFQVLLPVVALWLCTLVAYRQSFAGAFVFDDVDCILNNPAIGELFPAADKTTLGGQRQLVHFTFALNYRLRRFDPLGYHAVNFVIHALAGSVLFGLVRRSLLLPHVAADLRGVAQYLAFAAALLWLLHPLNTEAVTYIVQRVESLMGLWYFLTLYCMVRGASVPRGWPWYVAAAATACLGAATKEVMVTIPFVALLLDRLVLRSSWGSIVRQRGWLYAIMAAASAWILLSQRAAISGASGPSGFGMNQLDWFTYLCTQAHVLCRYFQLALWPSNLCFDYRGYYPAHTLGTSWLQGLAVLAVLGGSAAAARRWPGVAFLGLAPFFVLAPTSSVYPIVDVAAERRMYVPLAALTTLAVLAVYRAAITWLQEPAARRFLCTGGVAIAAIALALRTNERNRDFREPARLWESVLKVNTRSYRAQVQLALVRMGRADQFLSEGKLTESEEAFAQAEACLHDAEAATNLNANRSLIALFRGLSLLSRYQWKEAESHFREAIRLDERNQFAWIDLGDALREQGQLAPAKEAYQRAIKLEARRAANAMAHVALIDYELGDAPGAVDQLRKLVASAPNLPSASSHLAWILATTDDASLRNPTEAVALAEAAVKLTRGGDYRALDVLATAQATAGKFKDAVDLETKALNMAEKRQSPHAVAMRQRLELFQQEKMYVRPMMKQLE